MHISQKDVLSFKAAMDLRLHELGEPPVSLAEAIIAFREATREAAVEVIARRRQRGAPRGWGSIPVAITVARETD